MLSIYDMQCLARLEDRWLDPNFVLTDDKDDDELWEEADRRCEEKWATAYLTL